MTVLALNSALNALDYAVVAVYVGIVLAVALKVCKKQTTTSEYFLAGRSMRWWAVGLSLYASMFSSYSFVGCPGETYFNGMAYALTNFAVMLSTPIILIVFVRTYQRMHFTTAYEYLEARFNLPVRLLGSTLFLLTKIGWMATLLYALSLVITELTGIPIVTCIILIGCFSTLYTFLGGMRAVIWTDVIQFFVFFLGICAVFWVTFKGVGGVAAAADIALDAGKMHVSFSLDPTVRITFWGAIVGFGFTALASYGTDQLTLQRLFSTADYRQARKSVLLNNLVCYPFGLLIYGMGIAIFAYYQVHPLPEDFTLQDRVLPYFIANQMPHGLVGLLLAALVAAAMSSVDSGLNAMSACGVTDFYKRLFVRNRPDKHYTFVAKIMTAAFGAVIVVASIYIKDLGSVIVIGMKVMAPFFGALLVLFLMGIMTRRANSFGAVIGGLAGAGASLYVSTCTNVSFLWYCAVGCIVGFAVGMAASLVFPAPSREATEGLTVYDAKPHPAKAGPTLEETQR